jgi:adenosine/AMP kinase
MGRRPLLARIFCAAANPLQVIAAGMEHFLIRAPVVRQGRASSRLGTSDAISAAS